MEIVLVGIVCFAAGLAIMALLYNCELRRMACFLRNRNAGSNARLRVEAPGEGFKVLASAVNAELDSLQQQRSQHLRHQQQFQRDLASLSHDIRTPLMGAKGYLQLIQSDVDSGEQVRTKRLEGAHERLESMEALLNQLFAYARANDPDLALDMQPVVVMPLLAKVLVGQYPAFERRGWEPEVHFQNEALCVRANADALVRIFENLISNALRHGVTPPAIQQEAKVLTFSNEVIHPECMEVDKLFQRFYRADSSRTTAGTGLGLAASASLAQAMNMHLSAHLEGKTLSLKLTLVTGEPFKEIESHSFLDSC